MRPALASSRLHRSLSVAGFLVLLAWVASGLTHPLMGVLGPHPVAFRPPPVLAPGSELAEGLPAVSRQAADARLVRLVPGPDGPLWQLSGDPATPRRYLGLDGSGVDWTDADHAQWLARHYTGLDAPVLALSLQTGFDGDYPWVNRLLPVWRVAFDTPSADVAFIHTETGALVTWGDQRRRTLQTVFRQVHTLDALRAAEPLRVALLVLAMLVLLAMAFAGLLLALLRRPRGRLPAGRRWHRRLALLVALPLLAMAGSGLLHAWVTRGPPPEPALALPPPLGVLEVADAGLEGSDWPEAVGTAWLRRGPHGEGWVWLQRGGVMVAEAEVRGLRDGRHIPDGTQRLLADTLRVHLHDAALPTWPVAGFSPDYDFRNRRLPVVGVLDPATGDRVALDPASGLRVDVQPAARRSEAWTFAWLHKWNPVAGLVGRVQRDALQAALLLLGLMAAGVGLTLRGRTSPRAPRKTPSHRMESDER